MRPGRRLASVALLALTLLPGRRAHADEPRPPPPQAPADMCASDSLERSLVEHLRVRELLDAHGLAQVLIALCPTSSQRFRWQMWDALALDSLDEPLRAQKTLSEVALMAASPERDTAAVLLARSHLLSGDQHAFDEVTRRLPPPAGARLRLFAARDDAPSYRAGAAALNDPALAAAALKAFDPYERASTDLTPWVAGALSAVLPGAGQVYAGSWQGAAVAFVLNVVLIGATVELAHRGLGFSACATGLAASIFYVGNIFNAADLASRRNQQTALPDRDKLERLLIPEAFP